MGADKLGNHQQWDLKQTSEAQDIEGDFYEEFPERRKGAVVTFMPNYRNSNYAEDRIKQNLGTFSVNKVRQIQRGRMASKPLTPTRPRSHQRASSPSIVAQRKGGRVQRGPIKTGVQTFLTLGHPFRNHSVARFYQVGQAVRYTRMLAIASLTPARSALSSQTFKTSDGV